jgi:carbon monoxide dehydrogenase subunit G
MRIENAFDVEAPPEQVYALMLDPERVAPCIPGAQVVGQRDDGGFDATVTVKLGPMKMGFKGVVAIESQDDEARRAVMKARGADQRGQGNVDATMTMAVQGNPTGSHVEVATDMTVSGRIAQMGQGLMQDVAARMIGDMARNMEALLAPEPAPAPAAVAEQPAAAATASPAPPPPAAPRRPPTATPIKGFSLIAGVLWGRVRRLLGRLTSRS